MRELLRSAIEIGRSEGLGSLAYKTRLWTVRRVLQPAYNTYVRPLLPAKDPYPVLNGVRVYSDRARRHRLDSLVPWNTPRRPDNPDYERALVEMVENNVEKEDDVVIIGGGLGVSTVKAAQNAGSSGSVTVYEGVEKRVEIIRRTASNVDLPLQPSITHGIVGSAVSVAGEFEGAEMVAPADLPACDVLELDCEGAEIEILQQLDINPRVIIVETHANYGAPESAVRSELDKLGYTVIEKSVEVADRGIYLLTAVRHDDA